jgi:Protein of unknown function (DUF5818)
MHQGGGQKSVTEATSVASCLRQNTRPAYNGYSIYCTALGTSPGILRASQIRPHSSRDRPGRWSCDSEAAIMGGRMKTTACQLVILVLFLASLGLAQKTAPPPSPSPAPSSATPAIADSGMQAPLPQPAGQAASEPIPPAQQQQPEDRPAPGRPPQSKAGSEPRAATPQQDTALSFTGTILKSADQFVLNTQGGVNFELDDQERARGFAGTRVKVTGTLDSSKHKIHVEKIQPLV